jgi:hypothetical protein
MVARTSVSMLAPFITSLEAISEISLSVCLSIPVVVVVVVL